MNASERYNEIEEKMLSQQENLRRIATSYHKAVGDMLKEKKATPIEYTEDR